MVEAKGKCPTAQLRQLMREATKIKSWRNFEVDLNR